MKKLIVFCSVIFLFFISGFSFTAESAASTETEIEAVTLRFFNLLKEGDENALMSLLGDEFISKREKVISNPNFKDFIKKYYQNSQFNIVSIEKIDNRNYAVCFEILRNGKIEKAHTIYFNKKMNAWKMKGEKLTRSKTYKP